MSPQSRRTGLHAAIGAAVALEAALAAGAVGAGPQPAPPQVVTPLTASADWDRAAVAGAVVRVTTLAADGSGSLRRALAAPGPRLVVFEVGGVIDLGGRSLEVREPEIVVAGETAPDPGITLIRGGLVVAAHNVVIRHVAVRPGDNGRLPGARWEPDGISAVRTSAGPVHSVLFENVSATWGIDENASVSGPADADSSRDPDATARDVVFRRCLFAEGLSRATHSKGEHSKGLLIHDGVRGVGIAENLFAHNRERNPRLKGGVRAVVRDNLIYNWGSAVVGVGRVGNNATLDGGAASVLGNVAIAGPDSGSLRAFVRALDPGAPVFARDNVAFGTKKPVLPADAGVVALGEPPKDLRALPSGPAAAVVVDVLRRSGARPARRDPVDARIVRSVIDGSGAIVDSQDAVGGYPKREATRRELVVPDGESARRAWLAGLRVSLDVDSSIDLQPLLDRLGLGPEWTDPLTWSDAVRGGARLALHLVGDSTMATKKDHGLPERGWGEPFAAKATGGLRVLNHAMNGRSTRSFRTQGRWDHVLGLTRPGDFVLVQFAHNDQKADDPERFASPEDYEKNLAAFVAEIRARGARPLLATPVVRRRFDATGTFHDAHGPYPAIARRVAQATGAPLVDLHAATEALLRELGPEGSKALFLIYRPGEHPRLPQGFEDNTHFSPAGAERVARLAVAEILRAAPELAAYMKP